MTWPLFAASLFIAWLIGGFANSVLLHRFYSHKSFTMPRWLELTLLPSVMFLGQVAGPVTYAAIHRQHHRKTDTEFDPHSPHAIGMFTIMSGIWEMFPKSRFANYKVPMPKDLARDPVLMFIHNNFHKIWLVMFTVTALINWHLAVILFSWPCFHLKYAANLVVNGAVCHPVINQVRNSPANGFATFGEAIHQFHHDYPAEAYHTNKWWLDPGAWCVKWLRTDTPRATEQYKL
jgi:fatty-acid desaturase